MLLDRNISLFSVILVSCLVLSDCTHLKGTFRTDEFFKFLIKFGFQKTDRHQPDLTHGYIFGNITSNSRFPVPVTLAVLDRYHFLEFYKNSHSDNVFNKDQICKQMFRRLNFTAYDSKCSPKGKDYLRRIPCPKGKLCIDETDPYNVVKHNQFTYVVQDFKQPS